MFALRHLIRVSPFWIFLWVPYICYFPVFHKRDFQINLHGWNNQLTAFMSYCPREGNFLSICASFAYIKIETDCNKRGYQNYVFWIRLAILALMSLLFLQAMAFPVCDFDNLFDIFSLENDYFEKLVLFTYWWKISSLHNQTLYDSHFCPC